MPSPKPDAYYRILGLTAIAFSVRESFVKRDSEKFPSKNKDKNT